jgi:serine/threonine-protein kinase
MGAFVDQPVASVSVEARLAELERVLSSKIFAHSARLGRFLKFGVESALAGRTDVNEYSIGVDVFGRDASFDPRIDPIVRVDARRLRTKLREYYEGEGVDNRLEICLPLRTYVPVFRTRDGQPTPATSVSQFRRENCVRESIGVFPFTNLSADQDGEYFADGLTEELIFALATLNQWRVVAGDPTTRSTRRPDLREINTELNIDAAVWGTVRKSESSFRISAQLFTIKDRIVLWSQMFEAPVDNVVPMQTEIARAICNSVRLLREIPRTGPRQPAQGALRWEGAPPKITCGQIEEVVTRTPESMPASSTP